MCVYPNIYNSFEQGCKEDSTICISHYFLLRKQNTNNNPFLFSV